MKTHKNKAFTLVELIVVITILAVLWTIAFISLQWFASSARDSTRINDLHTISKALEIYRTEQWHYPDPTNANDITYSWSVAWSQWLFEKETQVLASTITSVPTDPLTGNPYTYSRTASRQEFELWAISEKQITMKSPLIAETYASENYFSHIVWNYNKKIVTVSAGDYFYVLWVPTLVTSEINSSTVQNVLAQYSYSIKGSNTIASSYMNNLPNGDELKTGTSFTPGSVWGDEVLLYSGEMNSLSKSTNRQELWEKLITYYSESNLNDTELKAYTSADGLGLTNSLIQWNVANLKSYNNSSLSVCPTVQKVDSNTNGYAVILNDGTLVSPSLSSDNAFQIILDVKDIAKSREAFAAVRNDGTVVTWWNNSFGADSSSVASQLTDITKIVATNNSFAALKNNGTIVHWWSTDSSAVDSQLNDIVEIYKDGWNFFARKSTGEFVIWGTKSQTKPADMNAFNAVMWTKVIKEFISSTFANTVLFTDGTLYSWGSGENWNTSAIDSELYNIDDIISSW